MAANKRLEVAVGDTPQAATGEQPVEQGPAPVLERLTCPHCRVLMHPGVGALHEAACSRCQGRFLPPEVAQDVAARFLQVDPQTMKQLTAHYAGRALPCPACARRMSQVPLRGVNVDLCAGCGAMLLLQGDLRRITGNSVEEVAPPPEPPVVPVEETAPPVVNVPLENAHPMRVVAFLPATLGLAALLQGVVHLGGLLTRTVLQWRLGGDAAEAWGESLFGGAAGYVTAPLMVGVAAAVTPILRPEIMQMSFWLAGILGLSFSWTAYSHHGAPGLFVAGGHAVGLWVAYGLVKRLEDTFAQAAQRSGPPRAAWRTVGDALRGWVGRGILVLGGMVVLCAVGGAAAFWLDTQARGNCVNGQHEGRAVQPDGTTAVWCEERGSGVRHGPFKTVDPMGRVRSQGQYVDGRMDGTWTTWHGNGQRHTQGAYAGGERQGVWTTWGENGATEQQGTFDRGVPHGRVTQYHPNGQPMAEGSFVRGERSGVWNWFNTDGTLERRGHYQRGLEEGYWETHHADGRVERTLYRSGKPVDQGDAP